MSVEIRQATEEDVPTLYGLYKHIGKKDDGYFEELLGKECLLLLAEKNKQAIGFGVLNFEPRYSLYKKLDIPEIQDLNVIPEERQKGVASALIESFETIALDQGVEYIGISVALTKDYGPAQRLYVKLGYIPDGNGVTYDREPIEARRSYSVDDDLCLMLVKQI